MYHLIDFITKKEVHPHNLIFTGENSPWEVCFDLHAIKKNINLKEYKLLPANLSKYLSLLPIPHSAQLLHWQESPTPLLKSRYIGKELGIDLYFKLEGKNPTGSFKDRGSVIEMTIAKHHHAKKVVVASTGNMAASCACYAALASIPCIVFVPQGTPLAKLAQVTAFGGKIMEINGSYTDAALAARHYAEIHDCYLAGDYAFRVEGQKTALFEILDQLSFELPDQIIIPMGCGTNIAAYHKGLNEYHTLGLIKKIPQLIGVQSTGANPIVRAFSRHLSYVSPKKNSHTIASAIAVGDPIDGLKALSALYETHGQAIAVTDRAILKARRLLAATEGLFVESASAATLACLFKLKKKRTLAKKIVCILTGEGLKDPNPL